MALLINDLNPRNIMLDEENHPVLIDFGSCKPCGALLQEAGTVGWIDKHYLSSEKKHDEVALQ
jgi:serine/threonine protein kinase